MDLLETLARQSGDNFVDGPRRALAGMDPRTGGATGSHVALAHRANSGALMRLLVQRHMSREQINTFCICKHLAI